MRGTPFFSRVALNWEELDEKAFPLSVPAIANCEKVSFHPAVTYFTGENGSGKSTLIEAIAMAAGFNAEGGTKGFRTESETTDRLLPEHMTLVRNPEREKDGFFLRAESLYNMASYLRQEAPEYLSLYYGGDLHGKSHGESFLAIFKHRFYDARHHLFILDEFEAALSPQRQLEFLGMMHRFIRNNCQFIIATHSPILMSYPHSRLYWFDENGIEERTWQETEHFKVYQAYMSRWESMQRVLFEE